MNELIWLSEFNYQFINENFLWALGKELVEDNIKARNQNYFLSIHTKEHVYVILVQLRPAKDVPLQPQKG